LLSPWDDRVSIPSDNNSLENAANVVVVRKGDKDILKKGIVLVSLAQRANSKAPSASKPFPEDDKEQVQKQIASLLD